MSDRYLDFANSGVGQADALLHRGDEVAGDGAADDLVDELEPAALRERLAPHN